MINWYPGHMRKAARLIEENLRIVDAVIYVLDSRAPAACLNPDFDALLKNKPVLYALNKADTVERGDLAPWLRHFAEKGAECVSCSASDVRDSAKILDGLAKITAAKVARYRARGAETPVRAMVIGIPNCGKSTVINCLCRGRKTVTGARPGVTRTKQWVAVREGMSLMDTPGTLWPKLENRTHALHLAFIGSIGEEALDTTDTSLRLIEHMVENHPGALKERYNLDSENAGSDEIFRQIAVSRGCVSHGGGIDERRAARALLEDFRKQKFGKIMLEKPDD